MESEPFHTNPVKLNTLEKQNDRYFHRIVPERIPACNAAVDHNKTDLFGAVDSDKT